MSAVDRAAEIVNRIVDDEDCVDIVQALAAAGLLVTDEIQAVLDTSVAHRRVLDVPPGLRWSDDSPEMEAWTRALSEATAARWQAVDAYLASRPA